MRRWLRSANASAPRELRFSLSEKRRHALVEILTAITQRGEVVGKAVLDTTTEREAADGFLGGADGQRRVLGNRLSQFTHRGVQRVHGGQPRRETERVR